MDFDMSKVECYNHYMKGHFLRECRSPKDSRRNGAAEPQRRTVPSYQAEEEPANLALIGFSSLSSSSDIEVFTHAMFDCDDYLSSKIDCESWPPSSLYARFQPSGRYHVVPTPLIGTFMPPKLDLVFNTAPTSVEIDHPAFIVQLSPTKPAQDLSYTNRPTTPIIEDWVSDSKDESKTKAPQIVPSFVQSSEQVKTPRHSGQLVETSIPAATPGQQKKPKKHTLPAAILTKSKPVSITTVRPVSAVVPKIKGMEGKWVWRPKCPNLDHVSQTTSASMTLKRFDYNDALELSKYVAFGGNLKGGKISGKGKIKTGNLVRRLPTKVFENDNTCVACRKGKQHRASCKTKPVSSVDQPLYRLYMDLFGPTFVKSLNKKSYCLVVIDDYSRFTWVFFLATKDETSPILKTFITGLESQLSLKGIKREFSVPRTPQQNGIAERKNRTLIKAARTMLACSLLPIPFWVEAVNTACFVQNRVLVTKPHNKTPYELLHGRTPSIGFMRPFGCHVTMLNILDSLGKFDGKVDAGFLVGYSVNSKAFRVFNSRTRIVQETLHVNFLKNKPNVTEKAGEEINQQYMFFPVWSSRSTNPQNNDRDAAFDGKEHDFDAKKPKSEISVSPSSSAQLRKQDDKTKKEAKGNGHVKSFTGYRDLSAEFKDCSDNSINEINTAGTIVPTVGQNSLNSTNTFSVAELEDITYSDDEDDVGSEADFNNLESSIKVSPIPTTRVHKDHHVSQIIYDLSLTTQTRIMTKVKQKKDGIFISQAKYVAEILRKSELTEGKLASTPIDTVKYLLKDPDGSAGLLRTQEGLVLLNHKEEMPQLRPLHQML
nr:retrovirus-related Pol polyprotein from transposon TNT 1-94 [Tanacetum cinerariifolium]